MAKELLVQRQIIVSAKAQGGYGRKLATQFMVGMPDVLLGLPPFGLSLWEVKDFSAVADKFDKQLSGSPTTPVTPKQSHELRLISQPYEDWKSIRTSGLMVAIQHKGEHRLVALPRHTERLTHLYEEEPRCWQKRQKGGVYSLRPLMEFVGIGRFDATAIL